MLNEPVASSGREGFTAGCPPSFFRQGSSKRFPSMAIINVPTGIPTLREAIDAAAAGDTILLADGTYASVQTLAKRTSVPGVVPASGYAVTGTSEPGTIIRDTRIYQENIDGPYGPGTVANLTLEYTSGGLSDGTALLRATAGAFLVRDVTFRGTHRGWDGNGNLYMSLTSFSPSLPITASLTLDDVTVTIKGQAGFNPVTGAGGSAFLHSWNNSGNVQILDSTFDEAGFLSSFNILNFPFSTAAGTVLISGNTFTRSENQTVVRPTGNLLGNVAATLTGNTFEKGSYLDLYDVSKLITLTANNFATIADGFGLRVNGPTVGVLPVLAGTNVFTGPGLPLKYVDSNNNKFISLAGNVTVNGTSFTKITAGGQGNDTINLAAGFTDWVNGDDGNDSINGGDLNDYLMGGSGADTLTGGTGNDQLYAGIGNDVLIGDAGNDILSGDSGSDILNGGLGNDTLIGGDGIDIYQFTTALGPTNVDTITEMVLTGASSDSIRLARSIFVGLVPGVLPAANFSSNATGTASGVLPQIVYDNAGAGAGNLFWAPSGTAGSLTLFATLSNAPAALSAASFRVI